MGWCVSGTTTIRLANSASSVDHKHASHVSWVVGRAATRGRGMGASERQRQTEAEESATPALHQRGPDCHSAAVSAAVRQQFGSNSAAAPQLLCITSAAALQLFFITSAVVPQHLRSSGTPPQEATGRFFLTKPNGKRKTHNSTRQTRRLGSAGVGARCVRCWSSRRPAVRCVRTTADSRGGGGGGRAFCARAEEEAASFLGFRNSRERIQVII